MTIRIHLTAEDLTETRFAFSPLWETVQSYNALLDPSKYVFHLPWMKAHREDVLGLDMDPLRALLGPAYMPDFLTPPPAVPDPDFHDEVARMAATPHEQVALEVRKTFAIGGETELPAAARAFLDEPQAALDRLAELVTGYWRLAVEPYWPRLRSVLEGDVLYRARRLATEGAVGLFRDLHAGVSWHDGVLELDKRWEAEVRPDGRGLLLIPLAFSCPHVAVIVDPPWQPTLTYTPRGIANLWEPTEESGEASALDELLGERRAAILRALESPMTTSEIAARVGVTPGAISQQLAQLRRAGVVRADRSGRGVYSSRTKLGEDLVGLLS